MRRRSIDPARRTDLMWILPLIGVLVLSPPALSMFDRPITILGMPLLFVYIFATWFIGIVLTWYAARRVSRIAAATVATPTATAATPTAAAATPVGTGADATEVAALEAATAEVSAPAAATGIPAAADGGLELAADSGNDVSGGRSGGASKTGSGRDDRRTDRRGGAR